jgi:RNA recognition motif-containing protein
MSPVGSKSSQAVSRLKRKRDTSPDSSDTSSSSSEPKRTDDVPVLSHAARRKQKKNPLLKEAASTGSPTKKQKKEEEVSHPAKRQNSVWVGNLCYKTTQESLRRFFDGVGEIARVHLPTKLGKESPGGPARRENRGCVSVTTVSAGCLWVAYTVLYSCVAPTALLMWTLRRWTPRRSPSRCPSLL